MTKKEALQQRKELLMLIEQWTRAEIIARFGRFDNLEYAEFYGVNLEKEDEIRQLIFGESELIKLAHEWGLAGKSGLTVPERRKKKKKK